MKNAIVGQSGGPTAVINSSLYGVISKALTSENEIGTLYGMINGIEGFLQGDIISLNELFGTSELELIKSTPGSYLGSCRYKLPESFDDEIYKKAFETFEKYNIGYFFYIGGNDSMDTVNKLTKYAQSINSDIKFIGIPKTIDNDLVQTDHTPGFGSAAKYVASTLREICIDACVYGNTKAVTIVEVMGRHSGWLTGASALARNFEGDNPMFIYLPENAFSIDKFISDMKTALQTTNAVIVCISEGIHDENGKFICEYLHQATQDKFGHKMLTGAAKYLELTVKEKLGVKVRSIELNLSQRCAAGYISATDSQEAMYAGLYGVQAALEGESGKMVCFEREDQNGYVVNCVTKATELICNKEKTVPANYISENKHDVTQEFIDYCKPLIQGEILMPIKDGLPIFAIRK